MITRRKFLQTTAAGSAVLATSGLAAPAIAQSAAVKLGYVSPQTGPLAAFGEADKFVIDSFLATTKKMGLNYEVVVKDSQSNPNRAAEVAKELIVDDEINLMLVSSTPETTNPVSTTCEAEQIPCLSTVAPWQPWFIGQQGNPAIPQAGSPSTTPITSSGVLRTSSPSSPACGARSRPTRRSAVFSRTTATAMPGATRSSASRRCSKSSAMASPTPAAIRT